MGFIYSECEWTTAGQRDSSSISEREILKGSNLSRYRCHRRASCAGVEPARRSVMAVLEREEVEAHSSICHRYCPRLSHQNRRESSGDSEVLAASPSRCSASSLPSAAAVAAAEASALSPPLWALEVLVGAAPHASALLAVAWVHHPHSNRRRRRRRRRASAWPLVVQVVLAVRRELPVVPPELPLEGVTQELARGNRRRRRRRRRVLA